MDLASEKKKPCLGGGLANERIHNQILSALTMPLWKDSFRSAMIFFVADAIFGEVQVCHFVPIML